MVTMSPPGTGFQVTFENESFNGITPTREETDKLFLQLYKYITPQNAFLRELFQDNEDNIVAALAVAKAELGGPFRGMFAGDSEIGFQLIRPGHVRRSTATTEAVTNSWTFSFAATTDYWLGFGTDNTTALNIDKRLLVVPLAVWWTQGAAPVVEEIYVQVGGTTYPVNVVRQGWLADNPSRIRAARIRPMIWKPKSTVLVQTNEVLAASNEMVLVGLSFAKGDLMRTLAVGAPQT